MFGEGEINKLHSKHIAIFGLGGVGGIALEILARCGIENFTLIDKDIFEETNINRQVLALHSNLKKRKIDTAKERILDINPNIETNLFADIVTSETDFSTYFKKKVDFIFDCIDFIPGKAALIKYAYIHNIPFLSSMGAGWKVDCHQVHVVPFKKVTGCPVARKLRKEIKDPSLDFMCVASTESCKTKKQGNIGSFMPVTAMFGLLGVDYIIRYLTKE